MNVAEKMTVEVNKINRKIDDVNEKVAPMPMPKLPEITPPSRKSQQFGAIATATISVGAIVIGSAILKSKIGIIGGVVGLVGAGISYLDSKTNTFKDKK